MMRLASRIAEHQALERILNAFLRERRFSQSHQTAGNDGISGQKFSIDLPRQKKQIHGKFAYVSEFGHHRYAEEFSISHADGKIAAAESWKQIADLLLEEIRNDSETRNKEELMRQIQNSIEKTAFYLESALRRKNPDSWMRLKPAERLRWMEQRLIFGHPFHPTPKSSEGFDLEDIRKYAPEMRAAFPLAFFAVHPAWIREEWIDEAASAEHERFPEEVVREAAPFLSEGYRLFPAHPWQARYLERFDVWKKGIDQGKIVSLNQRGPLVYPTSSVRSVWSPDYPYSLKLPLHVRITHFVRENTPEQIRRSLDASRVIRTLRKQWKYHTLTLLTEKGALQICPPEEKDRKQFPLASANVLFRENPDWTRQVPLVLASLLECWPNQAEPPLFDAIREAMGIPEGLIPARRLAEWLAAYVKVAFIPVLELFANEGVSLEAHVQNSMIHLEQGWPRHFYVRDMEGVSICKERARIKEMVNHVITEDSPVLYPEETAWERLQYYLIANHLGHLIHVLSFYGRWNEKEAWSVVGEQLKHHLSHSSSEMKECLTRLLHSFSIRAKANLISRFQNRSDSAIYIDLPNPMAHE